jgi:hypothetical protein
MKKIVISKKEKNNNYRKQQKGIIIIYLAKPFKTILRRFQSALLKFLLNYPFKQPNP